MIAKIITIIKTVLITALILNQVLIVMILRNVLLGSVKRIGKIRLISLIMNLKEVQLIWMK